MANNSTLRGRNWAKKAYKSLMQLLGGKCVDCGTTFNLQFDCVVPQGDEHHKGNTKQRIQFYREQHFTFMNVAIRCEKCNGRKGGGDDKQTILRMGEAQPF